MKRAVRSLASTVVLGACVLAATGGSATFGVEPTCAHPADILDLARWKVTLPTGSRAHPTEVSQPELKTFSRDPWFTAAADCAGVQFRAAVDGVSTSGSTFPRSELREVNQDGDGARWSTTSGTATMEIDQAITHVPSGKPHLVAGQIHDGKDDVTALRLEGDRLYVTRGDDPHFALVDAHYQLGTRFTVTFVAGGGQIEIYYNHRPAATLKVKSSGDYFKAGAYTQANCKNASPCGQSNYGEVLIYALTVSHRRDGQGAADQPEPALPIRSSAGTRHANAAV